MRHDRAWQWHWSTIAGDEAFFGEMRSCSVLVFGGYKRSELMDDEAKPLLKAKSAPSRRSPEEMLPALTSSHSDLASLFSPDVHTKNRHYIFFLFFLFFTCHLSA